MRRLHLCVLIATVLGLLFLACSDEPAGPEPETAFAWTTLNDVPPPVTLYGLWAPGPDVVLGVGAGGHIWQWDGNSWARYPNPYPADLFAITGAITGSETGPVVMVGDHGTALELVGDAPVLRETFIENDLRGVWLSDSGNFTAVGDGAIMTGTGSEWSADTTITDASLNSVWGAGDDDIFAVGAGGIILHHDGDSWDEMQSGTTAVLSSVSGTSDSNVYAVGAEGTLLHYNGVGWTPVESPTSQLLQSVCAGCGLAAVGANGTVIRLDNGHWRHEVTPGEHWLYAVAKTDNRLWAVGAHALLSHDGNGWSNQWRGAIPPFRDVISSPAGLVTVGDDGTTMAGRPGQWSFDRGAPRAKINAVWQSPSGRTFAAGNRCILERINGRWMLQDSSLAEFNDVGGNSTRVYAVGYDGVVHRNFQDVWFEQHLSWPTGIVSDLHAISMTETDGFIAGSGGTIQRYNGNFFESMPTNSGETLWDVLELDGPTWRAIAVGSSGTILGLKTSTNLWTAMASTVTTPLYAVARGPDNVLYVAGAYGTLLQYTDKKWSRITTNTSAHLFGACALDGALYVCGGDNTVFGGKLFRYGPPAH